MSDQPADKVLTLIEAYKHPIRSDILLYLKIHKRISLTELSKLIGKSKPTISRHIRILEEKNLVRVFSDKSENTPGNINPHFYELNKEFDHALRGENIMTTIKSNPTKAPEIIENVMDTRISSYRRLQRIAELTIDYLENMKLAINENIDSLDKIFDIFKDHTGHISFDFINKETIFDIITEGADNFDAIISKHKNDQSEINPYVYIKLLLPLKRIMDMEQERIWKIDGSLWPKKNYK